MGGAGCARLSPVRHGRHRNRTRREEGSRPYAPEDRRIRTGHRTIAAAALTRPVSLTSRHEPGEVLGNRSARHGPGVGWISRVETPTSARDIDQTATVTYRRR